MSCVEIVTVKLKPKPKEATLTVHDDGLNDFLGRYTIISFDGLKLVLQSQTGNIEIQCEIDADIPDGVLEPGGTLHITREINA